MADVSKQLQEQVLSARETGTKLNIVGAGSKAFMGRTVKNSAEAAVVSAHTGIVEYQPVELVLTARAGTPLSDIEAALAEHGQALHFEPPHLGGCSSLGGTLACNLSGPARPWAGSIRDQVLGIRLINGKGEHLRYGGQVMKNVAGYDVSRLQAGAMGTLGIITEISLKVMPQVAMSLTLVADMSMPDAVLYMNTRAAEPKPITAACWLDDKVYLRLAGARSAVEATARQWTGDVLEEGGAIWRALQDQHHDFFTGDEPLWRFSVKSTAPPAAMQGPWLLEWAGAQRWYRGESDLRHMEAVAREAGGQVSLFRGGDRNGEVMHGQPDALKTIQQRIKHAFDPDGLFNPGRLYSWL